MIKEGNSNIQSKDTGPARLALLPAQFARKHLELQPFSGPDDKACNLVALTREDIVLQFKPTFGAYTESPLMSALSAVGE